MAVLTFVEGLQLFDRQSGLALDDLFWAVGRALSSTWPSTTPTGCPRIAPLRPFRGVTRTGDFDDLQDLRSLLEHVRASDVFVILLTAEIFSRPWRILEIHAAVSAGIPIIGVTLTGKRLRSSSTSIPSKA